MSLSPTVEKKLLPLLHALRDRQLSAEQSQQLRTTLAEDDDALRLYIDHAAVVARLHWAHASATSENPLETILGSTPATTPLPLSRFASRMPSWAGWAASLLLVGYFVAILGLLAWDRVRRVDNHERIAAQPSAAAAPALLTHADDAQWKPSLTADGQLESIPQTLEVRRGLATLTFSQGAEVIVEGPAEFEVRSPTAGFLRRGKLVAIVPTRAIGFTVETPTISVVDLGTEFGVQTDAQGATEVEVFKGKVEVQLDRTRDKSAVSRQTITLVGGEARRIDSADPRGNLVVREITPSPNRFVRQVSAPKSRPIFVQGVMASSEFDGAYAKAMIDGSGMKEDCHLTYHANVTPEPPYHFWLSRRGEIKNVFVQFEFGRPYRLDSMKVWNLNDGRDNMHTSRGVKQADIYVSTSGKWDPLTEPNEWKLLVDDFKFSVATGTDDYDTPDVIPLGGAEARFVAIVIADHLGPDPRPDAQPGDDYVGLSEVQFFGERMSANKPSAK